jgi:GT2 family glycosyltransferase
MGPGGGRHRCLVACSADYAVSFDDDSYPIDIDFFAVVSSIFLNNPRVAVLEAKIWHRGQSEIPRRKHLERTSGFTGCGHAIRTAAYRALPGYLSEPISYNAEEVDLSFQLWGADWQICRTGELRVFHDTNLSHHQHEEIVAGALSNTALVAFLNYPMVLWPYAALQVGNRALFCIRGGRTSGLLRGLAQVPLKCYRRRHERRPLPLGKVVAYLRNRN